MRYFFLKDRFSPIHLYRLSRRLHLAGFKALASAVRLLNFLIFNAAIPPQADFGKRTVIEHQGVGLVVHPHVTLGDDVRLFHAVTLGTTVALSNPARIMIGDRVTIYPQSVIVGPRSIGADAIIGAGSIVTKDIPAGAVAFGNPARVHRIRSEEELVAFRARFR